MSGTDWLSRFVAVAMEVKSWSKDARKQVGAIVVSPDKRHVSWGYNGLPAGFPDDVVLDRDTKNRYTLHAEENAIAQAAQDIRGWSIYVTEAPCLRCALAIHRAGITEVYSPDIDPNSQWAADQREASDFLSSMGVRQARFKPCD
jgi:dCMP deaminase